MAKRGRKSSAELTVIGSSGIETIERPGPPHDLSEEQADEWRDVVNRMPADWFPRETHALLADYCRHVVMARKVAQLVSAAERSNEFDVEEYDRLGKMAERHSRVIASLATRMRITQQSTYDPTKKKQPQNKAPWQFE